MERTNPPASGVEFSFFGKPVDPEAINRLRGLFNKIDDYSLRQLAVEGADGRAFRSNLKSFSRLFAQTFSGGTQ